MKDVYIKITNDGEIDSNAFTLIGASTKRNDASSIGFFGSGLKYALAVLLRNKIKLKIFSGLTEIKVGTVTEKFRGQKFERLTVNGEKTSLTTDMGPTWIPWFAIREIYCNALDEGSCSIGVCSKKEIEAEKSKTSFYVELTDVLSNFLKDWNKYFSDKRKDLVESFQDTTLFQGSDELTIYRKGVQCFTTNRKCLYHYDLEWIRINESRVIDSQLYLEYGLAEKLAKHASYAVAKNILENHAEKFEENLRWTWEAYEFNENWFDAIAGRTLVNRDYGGHYIKRVDMSNSLFVSSTLLHALNKHFGDRVTIFGVGDDKDGAVMLEKHELTEREKECLTDVLDFFKAADVTIDSPIVVVTFDSATVLGRAHDNKICLSKRLFEMSKRKLAEVLYEEHLHLKTGYNDETREFQNSFLEELITSYCKLANRIL